MGFLTSLFGGETNYFTMIVALAIVLALIVLAIWLLKLLSQTTQSLGRGRQKRLVIVDSISIDQKRQAVIIRRDTKEHLIVIGGPNDILVESGFEAPPVPAAPARPSRRMMQPPVPAEPEAPSAAPARTDAGADKPKTRSLRHTGLLRANEDAAEELPGGKRSTDDADTFDSDTYRAIESEEPALETVTEAGDSDNSGTTKGKRK